MPMVLRLADVFQIESSSSLDLVGNFYEHLLYRLKMPANVLK
jgi:hypothetical protein